MRFHLKILLFFSLLCLGQVALAHPIKVTSFRCSSQPTKTRLVLNVTAPVSYTATMLHDRIVIELKNTQLLVGINKVRLTYTPLNSISSMQQRDRLRLVLHLKRSVKLQHFVLLRPARLVVDLYAADKEKIPLRSSNVNRNKSEILAEKANLKINHSVTKTLMPPQTSSNLSGNKNDIGNDEVLPQFSANSTDPVEVLERDLIDKMYRVDDKENGLRDVMVVIDPGHGGKDPGAIGFNGTREKDITLAVSKALRDKINKTKGFRAALTRNSDYYMTLRERLAVAHRRKSDMFISIHADAYKNSKAHGASIFALSQRGATSEAARWLAEKENESELGQAISNKNALLRSVLIDLAQTATTSSGLEIGSLALQELASITHLHARQVEQAAFVVLKSPDIPSLLVEVGFLSYSPEELKLRTPKYQEELAERLAAGITAYFLRRPPMDTYLAQVKRGINLRPGMLKDSLPS